MTKKSPARRMRDMPRAVPPAPLVKRRTHPTVDGKGIEVLEFTGIPHARARHLLRAVLLKRKMLADAYRYMRAEAPPEKRAEMRQQLNDHRRARKGWASV